MFTQRISTFLTVVGFALIASAASPEAVQAQAEPCIKCQICIKNGRLGHVTFNQAPGQWDFGVQDDVHPCEDAGPCWATEDRAVVCKLPGFPQFADVNNLRKAAKQGNTTALAALIRKAGSFVEVNAARKSLQLVGCGGNVVANIPIDAKQVALLQRIAVPQATRVASTS